MKLPSALLLVGLPLLPCRGLEVVINEFMASNHAGLADEDGQTADWIEVRNLTEAPVPLAGWRLTDDPDLPAKWTFPDVTLPALGYRVVFASGKNRTPTNGNLHTNFSLNEDGEYLALVRPDGHIDHAYSPYPDQFPDVSCGLRPLFTSLDDTFYYQPSSPGEANAIAAIKWVGQVPPVEFSHTRGFITNTVAVTLSCADPFATVLYTLDGSVPTATNGLAFASPIPIGRSDVLRATSIRPGFLASSVRTHTYVMPAEAAFQTHADSLAAGFPPKWGVVTADYGMDPDVVGPGDIFGGRYAATVADNLLTLPSVCLTLPVPDLFGPNGIYANPTRSGPSWERACSLEYIDPSGTGLVFQVNAGVQIIGGASRSFGNSHKKSFRLLFKEVYGGKRLVQPLFGPDAANSFDTLTLRMESNDGFSFKTVRDVQYARDTFARALHRRMGRLAYHSRPVHLYLNGIYWGVYTLGERPDDEFVSDYLGGRAADWDVINDGDPPEPDNVINGSGDPARVARTLGAWSNLVEAAHAVTLASTEPARTAATLALEGRDPDGTPNPALPVHLDLDGYIDYLLLNFWLGNADWPWHNYYAARPATSNRTGWVFFSWDAEWTLGSNGTTATNLIGEVHGCAIPFQYLRPSAEFRLRFADRAHRAFKPGGVLYVDPDHPVYDPAHPERNQPAQLYTQVSAVYERPLVAESARWGDQWSAQPLTVDVEWKQTRHTLTNSYFTSRTAVVKQQLRDAGLLPTFKAPELSPPGGQYAWGQHADISAPAGTIYYTVNGPDPRRPGGAVDPSAQTAIGPIPLVNQMVIRARAFDGVQWSALAEETYIPELRLTLLRPGATLRLEWNPIQNVAHIVQASPSLIQPAWTNLTTVITNGPAVLEFPAPTSTDGWFFRLQR